MGVHGLTCPRQRPFGPDRLVGIRPVPHDQPPGAATIAVMGPVAFRHTGIRLLGILSRRWLSAPLTIGLPGAPLTEATTGTPTGFPRSARARHDRGGCPLYPEARGVHTTGNGSPVAACRLSQRPGPITRVFIPSFRVFCDEASSGVYLRSPVRSSPRPVAPRTERGPWACSSSFAPPTGRTHRAHVEAGTDLEH